MYIDLYWIKHLNYIFIKINFYFVYNKFKKKTTLYINLKIKFLLEIRNFTLIIHNKII